MEYKKIAGVVLICAVVAIGLVAIVNKSNQKAVAVMKVLEQKAEPVNPDTMTVPKIPDLKEGHFQINWVCDGNKDILDSDGKVVEPAHITCYELFNGKVVLDQDITQETN